nr:hypothetical protein [Tanacetum cinerariifolium]
METTQKEDNTDSLTPGIYEIPGEPATVINGVPPVCDNTCLLASEVESDIDLNVNQCLSGWLEGRDVQKLFEGKLYNGKVTTFDEELGWYRVVYEDGDFEDLEWHELQEVLQPLDVTISLKTLASKYIKKMQKHDKKSGKYATKPQFTNIKS